jgi:hypothetical protein
MTGTVGAANKKQQQPIENIERIRVESINTSPHHPNSPPS